MLLKPYHTLSNNKRKKPVSDVLTKAIKIIKIIASVKPHEAKSNLDRNLLLQKPVETNHGCKMLNCASPDNCYFCKFSKPFLIDSDAE